MNLYWAGILEDDPRADTASTCTLTVAAAGEVFQVSVSGGAVAWVLSTFSAGLLVDVVGQVAAPGVIHARWVWPVVEPAD